MALGVIANARLVAVDGECDREPEEEQHEEAGEADGHPKPPGLVKGLRRLCCRRHRARRAGQPPGGYKKCDG